MSWLGAKISTEKVTISFGFGFSIDKAAFSKVGGKPTTSRSLFQT